MKVTNSMDHDEEHEQDGAACQANAVARDLQVVAREDRGTHFIQDREHEIPACEY